MCFGGNNNNDAKKALRWQQQQAADAARKEAERQARLKEGTDTINKLFDGTPVMGNRNATFDWTKFDQALPYFQQTQQTASPVNLNTLPRNGGPQYGGQGGPGQGFGSSGQNSGGGRGFGGSLDMLNPASYFGGGGNGDGSGGAANGQMPAGLLPPGFTIVTTYDSRGRPTYQLKGPNGQLYSRGANVTYQEQYDTGAKTGGFGDAFYNNYRDANLNYYMPELAKQYDKAKSNLTFDHARAGTLQSSMASENVADLVYQKSMNDALVRSKADNATAQLRNSVAAQKSAAMGQLYATEDPSIAANTATNSVRTLQNTTPEFSPMGELFKNAVVGASGFASGYNDYKNWGSPPGVGNSGRVVQ